MRHISPTPMTDHTTPDNAQHVAMTRLVGGDTLALDLIYQAHSGPVYRYLLALCGDASVAADSMHDAFVALIDRPAGFDSTRGTLGAYLAGIARRVLWARWRDPLHQALPLDGDDETFDEPMSDGTDDPLQMVVAIQEFFG